MVQGIIFDLYETLISEYVPEWKPTQNVPQLLGIDEKLYRQERRRLEGKRYTGQIADFKTALARICERIDLKPDPAIIEHIINERLVIKRDPFLNLDRQVLAMLTALSNRPVKIGILSNAGSEDVAAWPDSKLGDYVDAAIFSCNVGLMKPDARIYHLI
ncbi:MAG: HAD family hydrolase [Chloroflexota bacterium]